MRQMATTMVLLAFGIGPVAARAASGPGFEVRLAAQARTTPVDGRLVLVVSRKLEGEPRQQVTWGKDTQQIFAVDVEGLRHGQGVRVDASAVGYPLANLLELPAGTYNVQAVLNVYETVHRADGPRPTTTTPTV